QIKEDNTQRELTLELLQVASNDPNLAPLVNFTELLRSLIAPLENSDKIIKSEEEMLDGEQMLDENGMPIDPMTAMQGAGEQLPPE
ncbi:hypothetical protein ACI3PL_25440, partial [Lacticaseibacillus paracasei]